MTIKYRRVLLKCSGEALMGPTPYGIDFETVDRITAEVKAVHDLGAEVCLVIGGGNIFRGVAGATRGMPRASAASMCMLATVINAPGIQPPLAPRGEHGTALFTGR